MERPKIYEKVAGVEDLSKDARLRILESIKEKFTEEFAKHIFKRRQLRTQKYQSLNIHDLDDGLLFLSGEIRAIEDSIEEIKTAKRMTELELLEAKLNYTDSFKIDDEAPEK